MTARCKRTKRHSLRQPRSRRPSRNQWKSFIWAEKWWWRRRRQQRLQRLKKSHLIIQCSTGRAWCRSQRRTKSGRKTLPTTSASGRAATCSQSKAPNGRTNTAATNARSGIARTSLLLLSPEKWGTKMLAINLLFLYSLSWHECEKCKVMFNMYNCKGY